MPDRSDQAHDLADTFDAYWDALLTNPKDPPDDDFDPKLAATARRVHALDAAPSPHPVFASMLWEELMSAHAMAPPLTAQMGPSLSVRPLAGRTGRLPRRPPPLSGLAAAILLFVLLAGIAFTALYPLRQWDTEGLPLLAPLGTPAAEPDAEGEQTLLNLTLDDFPPYLAEGGMSVSRYPPGGSSREFTPEATEVFYIAVGPLTMSVVEANEPVRVIPAHEPGTALPGDTFGAGDEATLETGATLIAPPGTVLDLANPGTTSTAMLDLLWASTSYSVEDGGTTWERATGWMSQELELPVSFLLRRVTLDAGEALPASISRDAAQAVVSVDPERSADVLGATNGSATNVGDEPLEAYVLIVFNDIAASPLTTPALSATPPERAATLEFRWESEGGPDGLSRPYGLGIDPNGYLWVSDAGNDRFQILAPDGSLIDIWGTPGQEEGQFEFYSPNSGYGAPYGDVAFDADGNIYVADTGNFRVQKFAPDRTFLLSWGEEGEADGQFLAPSGIAIGPNGIVYVSDETRADVQMFNPDGTFLGVTAEAPEGSFPYVPGGIAVDDDGNVWVADFSGSVILQYAPGGELLTSWGERGTKDGEVLSPNDVALDGIGHIFVADDGNNRVQVFTTDGQFLAKAGDEGSINTTRFADAVAVAVSPDGLVYVSDSPTIQAFRFSMPDAE